MNQDGDTKKIKLEFQIEALLFYKNEPIEIKKISNLIGTGEKEVKEALINLGNSLENRGICLVMTDKEVSLATAPGTQDLIEQVTKDEMSKDIGKAGLETLAIILYNGPISRREIDYIRGVNSTFILRSLSMRGLVEREPDQKDQRVFKYRGSLSLLAHLGIKKIEELPEYKTFENKVSELMKETKDEETI